MANSALLGSIPSRCCSASSRGRMWAVGSWRLAAKDTGSLAGLRPGCVVVVAVRGFNWRPKALKQQHLRLGKTALLRDMWLGDYFTSS